MRMAQAASAAGVSVMLEKVPDTVHSFPLFSFLPESAVALDQFAEHVARALSRTVVADRS